MIDTVRAIGNVHATRQYHSSPLVHVNQPLQSSYMEIKVNDSLA